MILGCFVRTHPGGWNALFECCDRINSCSYVTDGRVVKGNQLNGYLGQ